MATRTKTSSKLEVKVEARRQQLTPVVTKRHDHRSGLGRADEVTDRELDSALHRSDESIGPHAGARQARQLHRGCQAHRGEPYAPHKGYVFSNAWVHQTVEAMSLA